MYLVDAKFFEFFGHVLCLRVSFVLWWGLVSPHVVPQPQHEGRALRPGFWDMQVVGLLHYSLDLLRSMGFELGECFRDAQNPILLQGRDSVIQKSL